MSYYLADRVHSHACSLDLPLWDYAPWARIVVVNSAPVSQHFEPKFSHILTLTSPFYYQDKLCSIGTLVLQQFKKEKESKENILKM